MMFFSILGEKQFWVTLFETLMQRDWMKVCGTCSLWPPETWDESGRDFPFLQDQDKTSLLFFFCVPHSLFFFLVDGSPNDQLLSHSLVDLLTACSLSQGLSLNQWMILNKTFLVGSGLAIYCIKCFLKVKSISYGNSVTYMAQKGPRKVASLVGGC